MFAEIFLDKDGNIEYYYRRSKPAPEGYENTKTKQIVEVEEPKTEWDDLEGTAKDHSWVFNRERWLNKKVRPERNKLLRETDWTQLPDAPIAADKKKEYEDYRQDLRNMTATVDSKNEQWAKKPE